MTEGTKLLDDLLERRREGRLYRKAWGERHHDLWVIMRETVERMRATGADDVQIEWTLDHWAMVIRGHMR